jgi:hypothetical protein
MNKNPAAVALGKIKSAAKSKAARENGKLGGRPRKLKRAIAVAIALFFALNCRAIPERSAIKAVIGEAGGESFRCQTAVAEVIRRQGSLRGIYGVGNPAVQRASPAVFRRAGEAWAASAGSNLAPGCKFFGGAGLDDAYFARIGKKPAVRIGRVNFYR